MKSVIKFQKRLISYKINLNYFITFEINKQKTKDNQHKLKTVKTRQKWK